ncbi:MAG TPA: hypothetical protein VF573_06450 [Paraburkholderia sp.]|uniref:hypothetical protein n=1 Tax=Paraburkholderia sp. TaxID=1926495 RepID=UPI002ED2CE49
MLTLSGELDKLRQADTHIVEAVRRIEQQQIMIASMPPESDQKTRAEDFLLTMQTTLTQFQFHREAIVENIARLRMQSERDAG